MYNYPLNLSFKILALNPQIKITDSSGDLVLYVKQKAFRLKEDVRVFADEAQTQQLFQLSADRIIDWSAKYTITAAAGKPIGQLRRKGLRSIFKATYEIFSASGQPMGQIHEENPWIKFADSLLAEIPLIGIASAYLFQPAYLVEYMGKTVLYLKKQPAFFEGRFIIEKRGDFTDSDEPLLLTGIIMALVLERARG